MKRKKILFIGEINRPIANANGICLETLAENLSLNHDVTISTYKFGQSPSEETISGVDYVRIKPTFFYRMREFSQKGEMNPLSLGLYRLSLLLNKVKKLILIPFYPISSLGFILRYYRFLKKLHEENHFDIIVSMYFPIDSIIVGSFLKKHFPSIKHVIYLIDTISNGAAVPFLSQEWIVNRGIKWEKYFMKHSDMTLIFNAHKKHYQSDYFIEYIDRINYTDVPLFKPGLAANSVRNAEGIELLYSGSLIPGLRSPEKVLELFSQPLFDFISLSFYTQGGYEDILKSYSNSTQNRIKTNGYVSHDEITQKISSADLLISIGNSNSSMIPSKTFEYMSTGKPIIHFSSSDADSSLPYYEMYPNCLIIDTRTDLSENTQKIYEFIKGDLKEIDVSEISSLFKMNTPEFTNNLILRD